MLSANKMAKRDFYDILGMSRNSSKEEIKKAYRKVALKYHPDRNPGDKEAENKFKEAAEAYEILSDDNKRSTYDQFGHDGLRGGGFGGGGMNVEDIFSNFGDIFGDPFEAFFGGGGRGQTRQRSHGTRGSNLRIKVKLTLEDIANGVEKKIKVKKYIGCSTCDGTGAKDGTSFQNCSTCNGTGYAKQITNTILGQIQTTTTCPSCRGKGKSITARCNDCNGDGKVYEEETIKIEIPGGVSDGVQLSMSGKGNAGEMSGPPGDLIVSIEEIQHEHLVRDGNNVLFNLYITFVDATLGTEVEVPTIKGKAKIKVPAGTQAGKFFRLKGQGLPSINSYGKGDQLIYVNVWTPKEVSAEERKILEGLRDAENFKPNPGKGDQNFFERVKHYFS